MFRRSTIALLFASAALAQSPSGGPRLGFVEKIYIEPLGTDDAARYVRDQLSGAFFNRTKGITLVTSRDQAEAVLIGSANVRSGYRAWAIGSQQASAAAAAVVTANGSAAAASGNSRTQLQSGGGTIRITELGLQLVSTDGRILWAYDESKCLNKTALALTGKASYSPATVCAVQQLTKAMDRDEKAALLGRR